MANFPFDLSKIPVAANKKDKETSKQPKRGNSVEYERAPDDSVREQPSPQQLHG